MIKRGGTKVWGRYLGRTRCGIREGGQELLQTHEKLLLRLIKEKWNRKAIY